MVTKNIRSVTYLPPTYHQKIRQYMKQQKLSESAALVEMVKQFFDEPAETKPELKAWVEQIVTEQLTETQAEVTALKAQMELMQQLLSEALSGKSPRQSRSPIQAKLMPLKAEDLARRLGVNADTLEKEAAKGSDHFRVWSRSKDMSRVTWSKRGNRYHPYDETLEESARTFSSSCD